MNKCAFCMWSFPSDNIKQIVPIFYCDHQDLGRPEACEQAIETMLKYNKERSSGPEEISLKGGF